MKTRKVIFALFFTLGLVVFGLASISFSSDLLKNKNAFTASLAEVEPASEVGPPAGGPTSTDFEVEEVVMPEVIIEEEVSVSVAIYSKQDQIDDILEKIDILQRQIADLQAEEELNEQELVLVDDQPAEEKPKVTVVPKVSGGSQRSITIYPTILISEVQITGETDSKQEFVELFNPNDHIVDLDNWYLQRRTETGESYSSFASSTLFSGKKISAKGYFLIAREGSEFAPDIFVTSALTENNSLILKNPNGDRADKLGWGHAPDSETAPAILPPVGQSIGRKFIDNTEVDTQNNLADFEINVPTPLTQNIAYMAPMPQTGSEESQDLISILISQVQTEGVTVKDEFVLLHNPNDVDVDLMGFSLKKKTFSENNPEGTESNLVSAGSFTGVILAQGDFLIAPQDNEDGTKNYTGEIEPNLRYSGTSFSIASGNTILLYNADDALLDEYITEDEGSEPSQDPPIEDPPPDDPPPSDPPAPEEQKVVISEIAWMGTSVSVNDEWMELYNAGETAVDLSGWALASADGTPTILLSGSIDAHGFYLLERTDDDSVPGVLADNIYTGALGNEGEYLQLKDSLGNMKDEVNSAGAWFTGDNETKQTMQRKDVTVSGSEATNWQTSENSGGSPRF